MWGRCTSQIMGYTGINYSSPTLASAISNLVPAFTFILAIIFRFLYPIPPPFFFSIFSQSIIAPLLSTNNFHLSLNFF